MESVVMEFSPRLCYFILLPRSHEAEGSLVKRLREQS